ALDAGANDISLVPGSDFFTDALKSTRDPRGLGFWNYGGLNRLAPAGQFVQGGYFQITKDRHGNSARNRRCRHHQHVRESTLGGFHPQRIALFYAEAVLLINNDH